MGGKAIWELVPTTKSFLCKMTFLSHLVRWQGHIFYVIVCVLWNLVLEGGHLIGHFCLEVSNKVKDFLVEVKGFCTVAIKGKLDTVVHDGLLLDLLEQGQDDEF
jgi:hypothetical protein